MLEFGLERSGTGWLVGNKCTFADLAFVTWNWIGEGLLKDLGRSHGLDEKYPCYAAWSRRLGEREEVRSVRDRMAQGRAEHGLQ